MVAKILVATPKVELGELIRLTLESATDYQVEFAGRTGAILEHCRRTPFNLLILDSEMAENGALSDLGKAVLEMRPGIDLMALIVEKSAAPTPLKNLPVKAYLTKPFFLPTLIETIKSVVEANPEVKNSGGGSAFSRMATGINVPRKDFWNDPIALASFLKRWLGGSTANGALIVNDRKFLASSGNLSTAVLVNLSDQLVRYAREKSKHDLARYIALPDSNKQVLFYAVHVPQVHSSRSIGQLAIGLVFDAKVSFSTGRGQVKHVLKALIDPFLDEMPAASQSTGQGEISKITGPLAESPSTEPVEAVTTAEPPSAEQLPPEPLPEAPIEEPEIESSFAALAEIMEDVPPPGPFFMDPPDRWHELGEEDLDDELVEDQPLPGQSDTANAPTQPEDNPGVSSVPLAQNTVGPAVEPQAQLTGLGPDPAESADPPCSAPDHCLSKPDEQFFTFYLIPTSPAYDLSGDLGHAIENWLPQICLDQGWTLQKIILKADYLCWIAGISIETSPEAMLSETRKRLNSYIYYHFPYLAGAPGEFLASDTLVLSGEQSLSNHLLEEFIQRTHAKQRSSEFEYAD